MRAWVRSRAEVCAVFEASLATAPDQPPIERYAAQFTAFLRRASAGLADRLEREKAWRKAADAHVEAASAAVEDAWPRSVGERAARQRHFLWLRRGD